MALSTYDDLKASIASWLARDDLTGDIPDFIALGEDRISRYLRISDMETIAYATLDENGEVGLPIDFIEMIQVRTDNNVWGELSQISLTQQMRDYGLSSGGVGTHYVVTGNTLSTFPAAGEGEVTIVYYAKPTPLDAGNQTNWLLTKSPRIYLYASLCESAPFLEDDARLQTWNSLYQDAASALQRSDEMRAGLMTTRVYLPHE